MKFMHILFCMPLFLFSAAPAHAWVDRGTAVVRIMNKAAGKSQEMKLPVGQTTKFEKLNITVRTCKQSDPFAAEEFYMFAQVSASDAGLIFSGWMSRNEPGDNPLQHADYDLWLVRCE